MEYIFQEDPKSLCTHKLLLKHKFIIFACPLHEGLYYTEILIMAFVFINHND